MSSGGKPAPLWTRPWLIFGVALALRLAVLGLAPEAAPVKDEIAYLERGHALLEGRGYLGSYQSWVRHDGWRIMDLPQYPGAYQAPGYPTFVAAMLAVGGGSRSAVVVAQCVLGAASCLLVFGLGRSWFDRRIGAAAAWITALHPELVAFTQWIFSETLFVFLWLGALHALFAARGLPSLPRSALAGAALGAAALTRGTLVGFLPVLGLAFVCIANGRSGWPRWRELEWRRPLARIAVALLVACAVIAPWSIRSSRLHGGFVLVDTNAPYNLWRGNAPGALVLHDALREGDPRIAHYPWPFASLPVHPVGNLSARQLVDALRRERGVAQPGDLEVADYARQVAWREIRRDPRRFARNAWRKLVDMWNPTSFLVRHVEVGAFGAVPPAVRALVLAGSAIAHGLLVGAALLGFVRLPGDRRLWLVLAFTLYLSAIAAVAFGITRFRVPALPLLALPAAVGILGWRPGARAPAGADVRAAAGCEGAARHAAS